MQAKLLRVLQERRFERVGGSQTVEVDVRVIAATNRDLLRLCKEGKFREDLYYRLNVVKIDLPPLHERPEDIPLLAAHFAQQFSRPGTPPKAISPEAMELLLQHRWPGNIRELENAIERATVTSRDEFIRPENLPAEILKPARPKLPAPRQPLPAPDRPAQRAHLRLRGTLPPPRPEAHPRPHRPHRPAHRAVAPHHHRQDRPVSDR